jgi:hypothetical protein
VIMAKGWELCKGPGLFGFPSKLWTRIKVGGRASN